MNVKKSLVEQIIKEEVIRFQELKTLQEEKLQLKKQLNELFEDENVEEGIFNKGKTREQALQIIQKHPTKNKAYQSFVQNSPEKAEAYVNFFMKNPNANYPIWDEVKKMFYNKESYSTHSGAKATPGPGINEDIEEGFLGMGTDWNNKDSIEKGFVGFWDSQFKTPRFRKFKRPSWTLLNGGQGFNKAIEAAQGLKSFDIKYNTNTNEFTKRKAGPGFGGQNIMGAVGGSE